MDQFVRKRRERHLLLPLILLVLTLGLTACGGGGGGGGAASPPPPPPPPPPPAVTVNADAGGDQQLVEETLVQLAGAGSASNGGAVAYAWSQTRGPVVSLSDASAANPTFTAPSVVIGYPQEIEFRLTINGPQNLSATDNVIVEVGPKERLFFRVADSGLAQKTSLYRADLFPPLQVRLSNETTIGGGVTSFQLSPDGQYIAYLADEETEDQEELFVVPASGGTPIKVNPPLASGGDALRVSWSPDGTKLAFEAEVAVDNDRELFVYDVALDQTTRINSDQLAANGGIVSDLQWSPDGLWISYYEFDPTLTPATGIRIHDVSAPSQPDIRITEQPGLALASGFGEFVWSPDSTGGYFTALYGGAQPRELYSVDVDGGNLADLALPGATDVAVSPDGNFLSSIADHDQDGEHSIFVIGTDGTPSARVQGSTASNHRIGPVTWAPDSGRLAFYEDEAGSQPRRLYTIRPDGTDRVRITFDDAADGFVSSFGWSPDSATIAFRENPEDSSKNEIFVADADGTNALRLSRFPVEQGRTTNLLEDPHMWSPDSRRIAYTGEYDNDGLSGMYTARRDGGNRLLVSIKPLAFRGNTRPERSWSSNSEGIAYVSEQETSQTNDLFYASENGAVIVKVSIDLVPPGQVFGDFAWAPSQ